MDGVETWQSVFFGEVSGELGYVFGEINYEIMMPALL
jgi:hypothetical protein